ARFVRITRPKALLSDFNPAFAALEQHPPRLVLIDADYLTLEPHPYRAATEPVGLGWRQPIRSGLASIARGDAAFYDGDDGYNSAASGGGACDWPAPTRTPAQYAKDMSSRRTATALERRALLGRL